MLALRLLSKQHRQIKNSAAGKAGERETEWWWEGFVLDPLAKKHLKHNYASSAALNFAQTDTAHVDLMDICTRTPNRKGKKTHSLATRAGPRAATCMEFGAAQGELPAIDWAMDPFDSGDRRLRTWRRRTRSSPAELQRSGNLGGPSAGAVRNARNGMEGRGRVHPGIVKNIIMMGGHASGPAGNWRRPRIPSSRAASDGGGGRSCPAALR